MSDQDYKLAYERQKKAREIAEDLLENRSRELYEANESLRYAFDKLKNQKSQIIHQEKLASLGQLSAGVAHEINNPTAYVKSNMHSLKKYNQQLFDFFVGMNTLLKDFCGEQDSGHCDEQTLQLLHEFQSLKNTYDIDFLVADIKDIVEESQEGINRIENIVKGLKDFSRPDQAEAEIINLASCIENTLKLVANQVKYQLTINTDIDDPLTISGQSGSLSQVFLNLIINASQAVEENGRLIISAKKQAANAVLHFSDNGHGMSAEVKNKIFDPFFTTKAPGKGTGLGLSISHSIIKKHGGTIEVNSTEGQGTEFIITLPLSE